MVTSDRDIIGASSFIWGIIKASVPSEIMDHTQKCLDDAKLPQIVTMSVQVMHYPAINYTYLILLSLL